MHGHRRRLQWDHQLLLLLAVVLTAVLVYIPLNRGSLLSDIPEVIVPVAIALGLFGTTVYLRRQETDPEQLERVVTFGWGGALAAGAVSGWWIVLHLSRGLPVGTLGDQILTVLSLGIGVGVVCGRHTVGQRRDQPTDATAVVAETTWINRSSQQPILEAIIEELAQVEGVNPLELDPLYEQFDPEVLDRLRDHGDALWQLRFYVDDYEVRVNSQGTITIYDPELRMDDRARTP